MKRSTWAAQGDCNRWLDSRGKYGWKAAQEELCVLIAEDSFNCRLQLLNGEVAEKAEPDSTRRYTVKDKQQQRQLAARKILVRYKGKKISPWEWTGAQRGCEILTHKDTQNSVRWGPEQHGLALKFTPLWAEGSFQREMRFDLMNLHLWSLTLQSYNLAVFKTVFPDSRDSLPMCYLHPQKEHFLLHQGMHPEWMYCLPCSCILLISSVILIPASLI